MENKLELVGGERTRRIDYNLYEVTSFFHVFFLCFFFYFFFFFCLLNPFISLLMTWSMELEKSSVCKVSAVIGLNCFLFLMCAVAQGLSSVTKTYNYSY